MLGPGTRPHLQTRFVAISGGVAHWRCRIPDRFSQPTFLISEGFQDDAIGEQEWYGTSYGGSTASILLNVPGSATNAVTFRDGYPMTQEGRGGIALLMTTAASFFGGSFGIILLMGFAGTISAYALSFSSAEYFSLMLLGLIAACNVSSGSILKGLIMVALGILFGLAGSDIYTGTRRFDFGILDLADGINLVALAMGLFGVSEVIASVGRVDGKQVDPASVKLSAMKPTREDVRRSWWPMIRGSSIGAFFGTLPRTGSSIAAFMADAVEKRVSKTPQKFGTGQIEGIMAPMLGALMIHGIAPGPQLMTEQPSLFWGLVMSFWIGNVLLVIHNVPLIGVWVRLLMVPYNWLFPAVLMVVCIGTYTVSNSSFDVLLVVMFGALGYALRVGGYPAAPMLLGFVLGPMMEEHFRRAMLLSRGDFGTFLSRPISATVLAIALIVLLWGLKPLIFNRKPA